MTNKQIEDYIIRLNQNDFSESIFLREINQYIYVAKIWEEQPKIDDDISGGDYSRFIFRFFFIKNDNGEFVSAVSDMEDDLHWFVLDKHRKKGHLTKALRTTIIPYLFNNNRQIQRITINKEKIGESNYLNSKKVATKLGFKPVNQEETEFELNKDDFNFNDEVANEKNNKLSKERIDTLIKRVNYAYKLILKTSDELNMNYNDDKELSEVAKKVNKYCCKIEDLYYDSR